jgi:ABC-type multidrug transport system fused ATPase/permease subunit
LELIVDSASGGNESAFWKALVWSGGAVVAMGLTIYLSSILENKVKRLAVESLRGAMLQRRISSDVDTFLKEPSSQYISLYTNDIETYRGFYIDPLVRLYENGLLFARGFDLSFRHLMDSRLGRAGFFGRDSLSPRDLWEADRPVPKDLFDPPRRILRQT